MFRSIQPKTCRVQIHFMVTVGFDNLISSLISASIVELGAFRFSFQRPRTSLNVEAVIEVIKVRRSHPYLLRSKHFITDNPFFFRSWGTSGSKPHSHVLVPRGQRTFRGSFRWPSNQVHGPDPYPLHYINGNGHPNPSPCPSRNVVSRVLSHGEPQRMGKS